MDLLSSPEDFKNWLDDHFFLSASTNSACHPSIFTPEEIAQECSTLVPQEFPCMVYLEHQPDGHQPYAIRFITPDRARQWLLDMNSQGAGRSAP